MSARQCSMCSNPSTGRCKLCQCSAYCSSECQKADWPVHKLLCKHLPEFATPPDASSRRGIFFPVDATVPQFVWVEIEWIPPWEPENEHDRGFENIKQIRLYIGDDNWDSIRISGNVIRSRRRQDQLLIFMKDMAAIDGSKPNRSVARVLGGDAAFHNWCGGILAMKIPTLDMDSVSYAHMDTVDFRDVVDTFRSYGSSVRISEMQLDKKHKGPVSPFDEVLNQEAARFQI